jgi:hypothetical protein
MAAASEMLLTPSQRNMLVSIEEKQYCALAA